MRVSRLKMQRSKRLSNRLDRKLRVNKLSRSRREYRSRLSSRLNSRPNSKRRSRISSSDSSRSNSGALKLRAPSSLLRRQIPLRRKNELRRQRTKTQISRQEFACVRQQTTFRIVQIDPLMNINEAAESGGLITLKILVVIQIECVRFLATIQPRNLS